ncbi:MAG TPA: CD225/dispanin family protein [Pseudoxanthomonas sp.]|nr:CD225/dispanin family protein [Pseudoxanthomonas sp.]
MSAVPPLPNDVPANVPNYLVWSILNTIGAFVVCCLNCFNFPAIVTGVVAIVFSSQVGSKLNQGDIDGAWRASRNAKIWNWVTTGITIVGVSLGIIYLMAVGVDGYMQAIEELRQQAGQNSN